MRLGPSLLPDTYTGRSTRHQSSPLPDKQRLAVRIGTLKLHGIGRSLNAQQFGDALERSLKATLASTRAADLPSSKYQDAVSQRNLRASAGSNELAQHLALLIARTLGDERPGRPR